MCANSCSSVCPCVLAWFANTNTTPHIPYVIIIALTCDLCMSGVGGGGACLSVKVTLYLLMCLRCAYAHQWQISHNICLINIYMGTVARPGFKVCVCVCVWGVWNWLRRDMCVCVRMIRSADSVVCDVRWESARRTNLRRGNWLNIHTRTDSAFWLEMALCVAHATITRLCNNHA